MASASPRNEQKRIAQFQVKIALRSAASNAKNILSSRFVIAALSGAGFIQKDLKPSIIPV